MKIKNLLLAGLTFFTLFSCKDDGNDVINNLENEKAYFSLKLAFPASSGTKATTSDENGDGYQDGLATEQQFQKVAVILVSASTNKVTDYVEYTKSDFAPEGDAAIDNNSTSPTSISKNYLAKSAKLVTKGDAKVYVFLNPTADVEVFKTVGTDAANILITEMTALTATDITGVGSIANANNFLMGNTETAVVQTIDGTVKNPTTVTIDVERAAVKLVENTATATFAVTNTLVATSVEATLVKYDYNNLNKRSFLLKNTESRSDAGAISGSYVVDPNFITANYKSTTSSTAPWYTSDFFTMDNQNVNKTFPTTPGDITYCLENTMISNEQYDNKTTSIVYQASIKVNGNAAATFYTYKNTIYTSYSALMAAYNKDYPNPIQQLGTVFTEADVNAVYTSANYTTDVKAFNTKLVDKGIKCYYNGVCYYNWMIKHWDQAGTVLGRMEFGVVRNNVYYLAVTKILNIGEPWVPVGPEDPDPTPDPDETEKASLVISINVLPWTVRTNDIEF